MRKFVPVLKLEGTHFAHKKGLSASPIRLDKSFRFSLVSWNVAAAADEPPRGRPDGIAALSRERPLMTIRTITEFPRRIRTVETEWIVLADGTRLAATIWLPEDAE